ncbi:hypothetical protein [Mycoplasma suis]|uniref:Uncharacterized protein n=1 Tax=Mycoplasma suis (strain Illinois) TaxID=768700 RepID=F0QQE2_MYCSL|nr:hypothetical protein [Mycoplasma suis]ADX97712.1 hypothetical protein MSU_0168 [Mycoplasma suis str. Illinois]
MVPNLGGGSKHDEKLRENNNLGIGGRGVPPLKSTKNNLPVSVEYILKGTERNNPSCLQWINGEESIMDPQICDSIIHEKWSSNYYKQPDMWVRADEKDVVKALSSHFNYEGWYGVLIEEERFSQESWNAFSLSCTRKNVENGKVEVTCFHSDKVIRK